MPPEKIQAKLLPVASFPPKYFLENPAVRQDHELWFVPPVHGEETVTPLLLFTFDEVACGITVRFAGTSHLYYSATAKKLFMRIPVDPETHDPAGEPELVVAGTMGDDFCIDEEAGVSNLTRSNAHADHVNAAGRIIGPDREL